MEREHELSGTYREWRLSWTAYAAPLAKYAILIAIVNSIAIIPWWVSALLAARLAYKLAYLYGVRVVTDESGVWLKRGLLPWNKGLNGVKWRDIDQARFFPGFFAWVTDSCSVVVGHRYTKDLELLVQHVAKGRQLVSVINDDHEEMARMGQLT